MQNRNRACAWVAFVVASLTWIDMGYGQQLPETKSPIPPPPVSFGNSIAPEVGGRMPMIATANSTQQLSDDAGDANAIETNIADDSTPSSTYPFGSPKPQAIMPLLPSTRGQTAASVSVIDERTEPAQIKNLAWSAEPPAAHTQDSNEPDRIADSRIQPAAHFNFEPISPSVAAQALQMFAIDQRNSVDSGKPISMSEWLAMTSVDGRPEMIRTYWNAFASWARCVTARAEADQLAQLREPSSAIERDLLASASSLARARIIECEMEFDAVQHVLARYSRVSDSEKLPFPSDLPLVDEYLTNYAVLAERMGFDPRLSRIDQSLPKTLQIIQARADAATQCQTVVRQAIHACNQNQLPLGSALEAIRMCRESQQEFVRSVERYNQDIAEYALSVAPFGQPAEQVVAMLIKSPMSAVSAASTESATANLTPLSRPPQFYQNNASSAGKLEPSNSLRTIGSQSTQPWGESSRPNPLNASTPQREFNSNASMTTPPRTANLDAGNSAASVLSNSPSVVQPSKAATNSTPPILQSGGGSFSFGNR